MISSLMLGPFSFVKELFISLVNLIPQVIYLLYASLACILDVLQLFFRKLAGLDVYYTKVDGKMVAVTGDIVTNFITGILQPFLPGIDKTGNTYPILSTVFWSMIVFGLIICFACTIVAIIKSHYNYDEKAAKGPMQYVYTAGKAVLNMIAVPIIVVLGLWVSQGILTALDSITSISSSSVIDLYGDKVSLLQETQTIKGVSGNGSEDPSASVEYVREPVYYQEGEEGYDPSNPKKIKEYKTVPKYKRGYTYVYYDIFGYGGGIVYGTSVSPKFPSKSEIALIGSSNQTFSGSLFRTAAYNGNRARIGSMTINNKDKYSGSKDGQLFANAKDNDELAEMIDTAFACHLHLKEGTSMELSYMSSMEEAADEGGVWVSKKYFTNFYAKSVVAFSKFNVGLVWYYYDLWQFNFIVGFAGVIVCASIFINIVFGLMTRLIMCVGLFLIAPPLFGLSPLDGGEAGKNWRKNFMEQVLMAYGSVVGMNIVLLILPYLNEINFFNIAVADYFARTLFIIVGLITIKAFIAVVSKLVGGADANDTGGKISEETGKTMRKAATLPFDIAKGVKSTTVGAAKTIGKGVATIGHGAAIVGRSASAIKNAAAAGISAIGQKSSGKKAARLDKKMNKQKTEAEQEMDTAMSEFKQFYGGAGVGGAVDAEEENQLKKRMSKLGFSDAEIQTMEGAARSNGATVTDADLGVDIAQKKATFKSQIDSKYGKRLGKAKASEATFKTERERTWKKAKSSLLGGDYTNKKGKTRHTSGVVGHAKGFGKGVVGTVSSARGTIGSAADTVATATSPLTENKFYEGVFPKPDPAKQTAANTADAAKQAQFQSALEVWKAQHPGQPLDDKTLKALKKQYGIK